MRGVLIGIAVAATIVLTIAMLAIPFVGYALIGLAVPVLIYVFAFAPVVLFRREFSRRRWLAFSLASLPIALAVLPPLYAMRAFTSYADAERVSDFSTATRFGPKIIALENFGRNERLACEPGCQWLLRSGAASVLVTDYGKTMQFALEKRSECPPHAPNELSADGMALLSERRCIVGLEPSSVTADVVVRQSVQHFEGARSRLWEPRAVTRLDVYELTTQRRRHVERRTQVSGMVASMPFLIAPRLGGGGSLAWRLGINRDLDAQGDADVREVLQRRYGHYPRAIAH